MRIYQIKITVKPYKPDEFIDSMRPLISKVRKEKGCHDFKVYRDSVKENNFSLVGEWETDQDMHEHFQSDDFKVLIGAAKVLGKTFTMNICNVSKAGGLELAKEKIQPYSKKPSG